MVSTLAKAATPREPGYNPYTDPLLALSVKPPVKHMPN